MAKEEAEIKELSKKLAQNPDSMVFVQLADACRRAGDLEKSVEVCLQGLQRHPTYTTARAILGRNYLDLGKLDEAASEFRQIEVSDPENILAHRMLGQIALNKGQFAEAIARQQKVLALDPDDNTAQDLLQQALVAAKQHENGPAPAATPATESSRIQGSGEQSQALKVADIYIKKRAFDEAIEVVQEILTADPENTLARQKLKEINDLKGTAPAAAGQGKSGGKGETDAKAAAEQKAKQEEAAKAKAEEEAKARAAEEAAKAKAEEEARARAVEEAAKAKAEEEAKARAAEEAAKAKAEEEAKARAAEEAAKAKAEEEAKARAAEEAAKAKAEEEAKARAAEEAAKAKAEEEARARAAEEAAKAKAEEEAKARAAEEAAKAKAEEEAKARAAEEAAKAKAEEEAKARAAEEEAARARAEELAKAEAESEAKERKANKLSSDDILSVIAGSPEELIENEVSAGQHPGKTEPGPQTGPGADARQLIESFLKAQAMEASLLLDTQGNVLESRVNGDASVLGQAAGAIFHNTERAAMNMRFGGLKQIMIVGQDNRQILFVALKAGVLVAVTGKNTNLGLLRVAVGDLAKRA